MMMKMESFGIDRGWARREMTDWGREMETERERNTTPRSTTITPTSLEENTGEKNETVQRFTASPADRKTKETWVGLCVLSFILCFVSVCVQPLVFGVVNMLRNIFEGLFALVWWCLSACAWPIYTPGYFFSRWCPIHLKKHLNPHKWLQVLMMRLF